MKYLVNLTLFVIGFFSSSFFFFAASQAWHRIFITTNYVQGMYFTAFVLEIILLIISLFVMIGAFIGWGK